MARPQRNNVDYFPFICKVGNTTTYIENTYGNDGFAAWIKILRQLAITDYHYLDLSSLKNFKTLCSTCKIGEDMMNNILNDLVEFGELDAELWKERIVWSDQFINSIEDAYKKRSNKIVKREEFIQLLVSLRTRKPIKRESEVPVNPQSKVEYSIVEESKVEIGAKNENEIFELMFSDDRWALPFRKNFEGKNIPEGWRECYLHHMQSPRPPNNTWEWRQKLNTWMINKKPENNGTHTNKQTKPNNSGVKNPTATAFGTL
jgi:hypothetical protein